MTDMTTAKREVAKVFVARVRDGKPTHQFLAVVRSTGKDERGCEVGKNGIRWNLK